MAAGTSTKIFWPARPGTFIAAVARARVTAEVGVTGSGRVALRAGGVLGEVHLPGAA